MCAMSMAPEHRCTLIVRTATGFDKHPRRNSWTGGESGHSALSGPRPGRLNL